MPVVAQSLVGGRKRGRGPCSLDHEVVDRKGIDSCGVGFESNGKGMKGSVLTCTRARARGGEKAKRRNNFMTILFSIFG